MKNPIDRPTPASDAALRWFARLDRQTGPAPSANAKRLMQRPRGASDTKLKAFARISHGQRA